MRDRAATFLGAGLFLLVACANRPSKPLVFTEQVGALPVQWVSPHCNIPMLSVPPTQPYEVIARVKTYGNAETEPEAMRTAIRHEACALGAQAVILQPVKRGEFEDTISVTHLGYSTDRDYSSTAEYAYQLIGLAIRYK